MVETVAISAGPATAVVAPLLGGGIASLTVGGLPVLRPFEGDEADLFSLASNILVPFSNRISCGGFTWRRHFHPVPPNLDGESCPIHGDGFQRPWAWSCAETRVDLTLENGAIGPWRYRARQVIDLRADGCTITLSVINASRTPLPFGGGFHPWFPRSADTRLAFAAGAVWLEDESHLPTQRLPTSEHPEWCFMTARALPDTWINNCFDGWDRFARIVQGPDAVSCTVSASDALGNAVVFSPGADSGFFCFEPVSHPVDAMNMPEAPGCRELAPDEGLTMSFSLSWGLP